MTLIKVIVTGVLMALLTFTVNAGFYKCIVNGKTIYTDRPCGNEQTTIKVLPKAINNPYNTGVRDYNSKSKFASPKSNDDYYSVENQLKRLETQRELDRKKRELREDKYEETIKKLNSENSEREARINEADCAYWSSRVNQKEHEMRKGYKSQSQRLSDETHLNALRSNQAYSCN